jgi:phosphoserine phosphatase RsbU/P
LLELDAAYRPAGDGQEIGGDFYDIFQIGDGDWMVAIGDVCGKGVEAAVVTAMTRYAVRAASVSQAPSEALVTVNEVMLRHGGDRFCTAVLVRLQRKDGRWSATVSAGGHPLPYLVDADGSARTVGRPGSLLGVLERAQFHDVPVELGAGQTLLLYTDGTTEGRRGAAFFGDERLVAALRRHTGSAASLTRGVLEEVLEFQDGNPRDDIALVAMRVPADPARGSTDG